jgi:hypothetical protein
MRKALFAVLLAGCASDSGDDQFIDGFRPPAPAADEIQIVAPPVRGILPGQDITLCSYIDTTVDAESDIINYQGYQSSPGGHHVLLYAVSQKQAPNTHECTEDDMINSRYLAGGGADSPPADPPPNVVFRIPAKTQLMVQTHWINATDMPFDGQGAFNLKVSAPSPEHMTAQLITIPSTNLNLPTGHGTASVECVIQKKVNIFTLGGHEHEWGSHVTITYTPAASATPNVIYDYGWRPEYQSNPPRNHYTIEQPFVMNVGDKWRIDCQYENNTGAPLSFPTEMCVGWAYGYPMTEQIDCVDGHWPQ